MDKESVECRTINWNRCIYIDQVIDDELVRKLTPQIMKFRGESSAPITVAINSVGGAISSMETLVGLLTGPNQDGEGGTTVAVVTEKAYSAAAALLASSTYAVALPHTDILFHDVRYGGIEDVTPASAKVVVSQLQEINDKFSFKLADRIFDRLIWNYIDLQDKFEDIVPRSPKIHEQFVRTVGACKAQYDGHNGIDLASFATCLMAFVSHENECLVRNAMKHLHNWGVMTTVARSFPAYRTKGRGARPGLLDGAKKLFESISKATKKANSEETWESSEQDMKLVISLLVANSTLSSIEHPVPIPKLIETVLDDFKMIKSIDDPSHARRAINYLNDNKTIFFSEDDLAALQGEDEELKKLALAKALPSGKMFWQFCVLLCRELFDGEHKISPTDAQVLGLIDEVPGNSPIQPLRSWLKDQAEKS
jgi:ATP-dependent protease ClpP protease subunit